MRLGLVVDCPVCDGRGVVEAIYLTRRTGARTRAIETCPRCAGTGAHVVKEVRA